MVEPEKWSGIKRIHSSPLEFKLPTGMFVNQENTGEFDEISSSESNFHFDKRMRLDNSLSSNVYFDGLQFI